MAGVPKVLLAQQCLTPLCIAAQAAHCLCWCVSHSRNHTSRNPVSGRLAPGQLLCGVKGACPTYVSAVWGRSVCSCTWCCGLHRAPRALPAPRGSPIVHARMLCFAPPRPGRGGPQQQKRKVPSHRFPKKSRGDSVCSTMAGGSWRLAVGSDWRLVVGNSW